MTVRFSNSIQCGGSWGFARFHGFFTCVRSAGGLGFDWDRPKCRSLPGSCSAEAPSQLLRAAHSRRCTALPLPATTLDARLAFPVAAKTTTAGPSRRSTSGRTTSPSSASWSTRQRQRFPELQYIGALGWTGAA